MNTGTAKLIKDYGTKRVIGWAHALGIESDIPSVPSIALGVAWTRTNGGVRLFPGGSHGPGRRLRPADRRADQLQRLSTPQLGSAPATSPRIADAWFRRSRGPVVDAVGLEFLLVPSEIERGEGDAAAASAARTTGARTFRRSRASPASLRRA